MTKSTHLLFKQIRWRVATGMGAAFALLLLIVLNEPPLDREHLVLLPFLGLIFTYVMGLHTRLSEMLFPVTDRQIAWIPLSVWGLVTLAGATGLILGQTWALVTGHITLRETIFYWLSLFSVLPIGLFFYLLIWRMCRIHVMVITGLWPVSSSALKEFYPLLPDWVMTCCLNGWPLWAAGCLFLIWEAPHMTARLRRLNYQEVKGFPVTLRIPELNDPVRHTWPTRLADGLLALAILGMIPALFIQFGILSGGKSYLVVGQMALLLVGMYSIWVRGVWKQTRASGMGRRRAALVTLIQMTVFGYAFRNRMGVARGKVVQCPVCRNDRMVWQKECPHCVGHSVENESRVLEQQPPRISRFYPRHDPEALFFRVTGLLLIAAMILASNWLNWFGN
jgi:hypothetical protein